MFRSQKSRTSHLGGHLLSAGGTARIHASRFRWVGLISEEPTQRPVLYNVSLKGPVKYKDEARHGDLTAQKKKKELIKIFPAVKKKNAIVNISVKSPEKPGACPLHLPNVPQVCRSASLRGYQSAFFFTEFGLHI